MNLSAFAAYFAKSPLALGRSTIAAISALTFGSTLLLSAVAPASAAASANPAYNRCPLPSPETSPIVRMITVLENDVMKMLGIAQPGCNVPE